MLLTTNRLAIVGLAAGLLAASAGARATSITQTFNIPTATIPSSDLIGYNLFNSNLGTLTSVTYELVSTGTAEVDIFNANAVPEAFTNATATLPFALNGPAGVNYSHNIVAGPISGSVPAGPGVTPFSGIPGSDDSGVVAVTSALWPVNWEAPGGGTGPIDFHFNSSAGNYSGSANPGAFFSGSGTVGGTLTLIYNYQTSGTPEPGAWALLVASAGVSIAGLRRRRACKQS